MDLETLKRDFDAYLEKMYALRVGSALLYYDSRTGGCKGGLRTRGKSAAILDEENFKLGVAPEMKGFLDEFDKFIDGGGKLDDFTAAKHRICRKRYYDSVNVPPELVREISEHMIKSEEAWEGAKNSDDYAAFAPYLKKNIEYSERLAKLQNPKLVAEKGVYNALLNEFEEGLTTNILDAFFAKLKARIVPLLKRVTESDKKPDTSVKRIPVPVEKQKEIAKILCGIIGLDLNRGEIKESEHPFTMQLSKYDVRLTTHYHENDFTSSVFSVLHEGGHGIYEQGKDDAIAETILDDGVCMALHESQSRFYENIIGRSLAFWNYALPLLKPCLGDAFKDVTARQMFEAVNTAQASLIRIEADELTYALHIMVRYEMEKEIFRQGAANIDVDKLPAMWNAKYEEYLGLTPPDDTRGILQDTHWSGVGFGYFPSYAQGSAYGAQMLAYMSKEFDVYGCVEKGDIATITGWLNKHIHRHGSVYKPHELFRRIAGEDLNADYFIDYLEKKYTELYDLK